MNGWMKTITAVIGACIPIGGAFFWAGGLDRQVNAHTEQLDRLERKVDRVLLRLGLPTEDHKPEPSK